MNNNKDRKNTIIFNEMDKFKKDRGGNIKRQFFRCDGADGNTVFDLINKVEKSREYRIETLVFFSENKDSTYNLSKDVIKLLNNLFKKNTLIITERLDILTKIKDKSSEKNSIKSLSLYQIKNDIKEKDNLKNMDMNNNNDKFIIFLNNSNEYTKFFTHFQQQQLLINSNQFIENIYRNVFVVLGGDKNTFIMLKLWNKLVNSLMFVQDKNKDDNDNSKDKQNFLFKHYEYPVFIIEGSGLIASIIIAANQIIKTNENSPDDAFEKFEREMYDMNIDYKSIGMTVDDFYTIFQLNERKRIHILNEEFCEYLNKEFSKIYEFQKVLSKNNFLDSKCISLSYFFSISNFDGDLQRVMEKIDEKFLEAISDKALISFYKQLFSPNDSENHNKLQVLLKNIYQPQIEDVEERIILIMYYAFGKVSNIFYKPFCKKEKKYAIWDLLIFGILSHNTYLIDYLLHKTNPIASCLVTSVVLNGLAGKSKEYGLLNLYEELTESSQRYNILLKKIYNNLFYKYWSDCDIFVDSNLLFDEKSKKKTILEIALNCNMKHFLAEEGIQKNIITIWKGEKIYKFNKYNEKSIFNKILTPQLKFFLNVFFYLIFLCLFSYFILLKLNPLSVISINIIEILLLIWVSGLFFEEMRQLYYTSTKIFPYNKLSKTFKENTKHFSVDFYYFAIFRDIMINYLKSNWNIIDILSIFLFFTSFTLRCLLSSTNFIYVRIFYGCTLISLSTRLLQFMNYVKFLGPKVLTMLEMTKDLVRFLLVASVFVLSFGVTYQAIVGQWVDYSGKVINIIAAILGDPFWRIFGELNLEQLNEDSKKHVVLSWLLPVLIGVYLIVMNILLINLLIAIFSSSYNRIEQETELLWAVQSVKLTFEYREELYVPSPLNLIDYFVRILIFLWKNILLCIGRRKKIENIENIEINTSIEVSKFDTSISINSAISHLKKFPEDNLNDLLIEIAGNVSRLSKRLDRIEEKIEKITI